LRKNQSNSYQINALREKGLGTSVLGDPARAEALHCLALTTQARVDLIDLVDRSS
jgi:hypothetical protein